MNARSPLRKGAPDLPRRARAARVRADGTGDEKNGLHEFGPEDNQLLFREAVPPRRVSSPTDASLLWSELSPDVHSDPVVLLDERVPFGWRELTIGVMLVATGVLVTVVGITLLKIPPARDSQPTAIPAPESSRVASIENQTPTVATKPAVPSLVVQPPPVSVPAARTIPAPTEGPDPPRPQTFVAAAPPVAVPNPAPVAVSAAPASTPPVPASPAPAPTPSTPAPAPTASLAAPAPAPVVPPATAPPAPVPPPATASPVAAPETARATPTGGVVIPAPPPREAETGAIQNVLARYRNAFNSLDAGAASAVWPTVNERTLARAFESIEEQSVAFDHCSIDVGASAAQAACTGTARYVPKVGSRSPKTETRQWLFNLRRAGAGWVIDNVQAR